MLRRLPFGALLASAYPYGCIQGDVDLFWHAAPAIARMLRTDAIARLEIPFTGPYLSQVDALPTGMACVRIPVAMDAIRHVLDFDVDGARALEQRFSGKIRWAIRKAQRNGCILRHATPADVDTLQSLYAGTMRAKHAPVNYGPERWAGIVGDLEARFGGIYLGEVDGKPAGMAAVVDGEISRHLIQVAVIPKAQVTRLGDLLIATAMQDALALGKRYFDFMASPMSDTGLIAFKAKWGSRSEVIRHAIISGVPLLGHAVQFGRWANRMRARFHGP